MSVPRFGPMLIPETTTSGLTGIPPQVVQHEVGALAIRRLVADQLTRRRVMVAVVHVRRLAVPGLRTAAQPGANHHHDQSDAMFHQSNLLRRRRSFTS